MSGKGSTQVQMAEGAQSAALLDEGEGLKGKHVGQEEAEVQAAVRRWVLL